VSRQGSAPQQAANSTLEDLSTRLVELLDQQTATSEVLLAVGRSDFELQPIFETVVEHAIRLCHADAGQIFVHEGDHFRLACASGGSDEYRSMLAQREIPLGPGTLVGRVALDRQAVMSADIATDPDYDTEEQRLRQRLGGFRTIVGVPIQSDDEVMAVISLWRRDVNPFAKREIELAMTFAAQGAIAIRNANLMHELGQRTQELGRSIGQLQGLSEVGEAVSSTLDLHEVLSTVVKHAVGLSGTEGGSIFEFDDESREFRIRTAYGTSEELLAALRKTKVGLHDTLVGEAARSGTPMAVADIDLAPPDAHLEQLARAGWRSVLAVPLLREGRILGALVVRRRTTGDFSTQITELLATFASQSALAIQNARLYQELAQKTSELEIASRHKSEFLASMSHELRTPLTAVIGFSEVLLDRLFGELNEKQERYLEDIRRSGRHLLELLNDILDLSKVEAGKMELELADTSLSDALEQGVAMVRARASNQGLSLNVDLDPDVGDVVADPLRLKQVVLNLLSNAVKFTPPGGRVQVRARRVAHEVHVTVEDTGIGISEEDQERIFESFEQGRGGLSGAAEGTGLGLTLSKRIVELHGGRLWVESRLGEGSAFTFTVPVATRATGIRPVRPLVEPQVPVSSARSTVLVVEDDRHSLELMTLYLRGAAFEVQVARSGEEGLRLARALQPTAIVLDIMLPGLDGWDLLAILKSDPRTARIPVVIASMLDERGRGFALGAADYLVKPVTRDDIVATLSRWTTTPPQTVVVLSDDSSVVELLDSVASHAQYRLLHAADEDAAVALTGTSGPAVMIIDVLTSGVDAFDVIGRVRADPRTAAVPIVVLTGEAMTSDSKRRLYGQIDRVARKSELDRSTLLALIKAVMSPEEREKDASGELILIVEDNEVTLTLLRDVLGANGYRTLEASSAEDALTLARAEGPQLILMDVQLPGMDGLAALRALRAMPETTTTPVIAVTAFAMKDDRERLLSAGFNGYLEKPVNVRELPSFLRTYLAPSAVRE
jgi:signal transduction histidine kinase/CheY-like chemotaxis protein